MATGDIVKIIVLQVVLELGAVGPTGVRVLEPAVEGPRQDREGVVLVVVVLVRVKKIEIVTLKPAAVVQQAAQT